MKPMQKFLLFILSISFWKYGQSQLSIDACQLKARRNYPLIKQFDLIDQSTQYNLSNAGKAYLPQVNLT
ncbi:transporter, partial [Acinetobacter baumannii]